MAAETDHHTEAVTAAARLKPLTFVMTLLVQDGTKGAAAVGVAAETDHHMEAVLVAPRLNALISLLPVCQIPVSSRIFANSFNAAAPWRNCTNVTGNVLPAHRPAAAISILPAL